MKPVLKYALIAVLVLGLAGIAAAGIAYAQGNGPHLKESLAELLGLTREELQEKLQNGETLEDLAEEAGVDLDAYYQENAQARIDDLTDRIQEALANGDITQGSWEAGLG
jgi:transcription elongation GreA/GreB family factor